MPVPLSAWRRISGVDIGVDIEEYDGGWFVVVDNGNIGLIGWWTDDGGTSCKGVGGCGGRGGGGGGGGG